ncbi:exlusion protein FxsA [Pelagivirga sediminicola]|uniref:Exlusion protein FxsA n=1 Tax=Pelagivirga sediminicola TaxID=2170575 RepID=A0A2T7G8X2_9RHOB|nr:FxsA family protein [Pelagivirga sediminicola]PVA10872.1 exlusion protein FxsA [Pelagivirga sediminicola]
MWLLLAFIIVPLIEIGLFIQVGGAIGLWPTLLIVILTAILGTWLMRAQGALALGQLRGSFSQQTDPTEPLAHGAMILIAGVLLLTPGFFTDAVGFLLLTPPIRRAAFSYLRKRVHVQGFDPGPAPHGRPRTQGPTTIEGDYHEVQPDDEPRPPSGWTRD